MAGAGTMRGAPQLFLYDVTSSYLEGIENALAAFATQKVPDPTGLNKQLLDVAVIKLPEALSRTKAHVATRKRLVSGRNLN